MSPGPTDTPILGKMALDKDAIAQMKEQMKGMVPVKRWGTTEEIAKAVLFLAFDATFTTGAELPVDGGDATVRAVHATGVLARRFSPEQTRGLGPLPSRLRATRSPSMTDTANNLVPKRGKLWR